MGDMFQKKFIESEMDRFEKEISSIAPTASTMSRPFIPAQLRRPVHTTPAPPGSVGGGLSSSQSSGVPPMPKPSPIIISGAPQVYNAVAKPGTSATIVKPPETMSSSAFTNSAPGSSGSFLTKPGTSGTIVKPLETLKASTSLANDDKKKKKKKKKKDDKDKKPRKALRSAGGQVWEDLTLQDWDPNGFRLFCGDLGNDVTDEVLTRVFGRYPSFQKAKVVRDKRSNKTKGFGFVSFKDANDFVRAVKELDGRYVGSRPIKLRKSNWRSRNIEEARKRDKERNQLVSLIKK